MQTLDNLDPKTSDPNQDPKTEQGGKIAANHQGKGLINRHGREGGGLPMPFVEQFKTAWGIPYARTGIIVGGLAIAAATYFFWPNDAQQIIGIEGRDGVSTLVVETGNDGELNEDQARYLADKQRQEAIAATDKGQTNAAVVVVPTATVGQAGEDTPQDQYAVQSDQMGAGPAEEPFMVKGTDVTKSSRFSRREDASGTPYYVDKMTGEMWIKGVGGQPELKGVDAFINPAALRTQNAPANSLANTNYQAQGDQGNSTGGSDQGSGGQGDGGGPSGDGQIATGSYDASQDADILRYRNQMAAYYQDHILQQQSQSEAYKAQQQALQAQQQALYQQRQATAQASLNNTLARLQGLSNHNQGFGVLQISQTGQGPYGGAMGGNGQEQGGYGHQGQMGQGAYGANSLAGRGGFSGSGQLQGNLGQASQVAKTLAQDPTYYSRQATDGLMNHEDLNYSLTGATGSASATVQMGQASKRLGGQSQLPGHVIRAGTQFTAIITKTANSDYGNLVEARLVSGPFAGSIIYGQMVPQGRDVGVIFNSLQRPNPRLPIIPLKASASNIANDNPAISTSVKRHYAQNYGHIALTSALQGYSDAYNNRQSVTTIERSDGTVVTQTQPNEKSSVNREIRANIAQQYSKKLQEDMAHLGNRPPTFIIAAGKVIYVRLNQDWDTTQVADSIQ